MPSSPYYQNGGITIYVGDVRKVLAELPENIVQCAVTSPPYWALRSYLPKDHPDKHLELGSEKTPQEFIANLTEVFESVKRVLRKDGTLYANIGDSYAGSNFGWGSKKNPEHISDSIHQAQRPPIPDGLKPKDMCLIPARLAISLQERGWWVRSDIPWIKRSCLPESCKDRPNKSLEYVWMFTPSAHNFFDMVAVKRELSDSYANDPRHKTGSTDRNEKDGYGESQAQNPKHVHKMFDREATSGRHFRNSDLFFESLEKPYGLIWCGEEMVGLDVTTAQLKEAHYASYPEDLIEPLILASTSAKGQCAKCGSPYVRITKESRSFESGSGRAGHLPEEKNGSGMQGGGETKDVRRGPCVVSETLSWQPTCKCECEGVEPQIVLDPFLGSGTTAIVAHKHGRRCIGIELNEDFAKIAIRRIENYLANKPAENWTVTLTETAKQGVLL